MIKLFAFVAVLVRAFISVKSFALIKKVLIDVKYLVLAAGRHRD